MSVASYLLAVGLPQYLSDVDDHATGNPPLQSIFHASNGIAEALTTKEITDLYTFKVPSLGSGEARRVIELEQEPYNLAEKVFNVPYDIEALRTMHKGTTEWLWRLNTLIGTLQQQTGVQWLGIYRHVTFHDYDGLVKLAFFGEYTNAVFPLTPEFSERSTISWVGRNGKARLISDLTAYKGGYFHISDNEKSELCMPIYGGDGEVVGVINAESWEVGECALPKVVIPIAKACVDLANTEFATVAV